MTRGVRSSSVLTVVTLALAGVGLGHVGEYLLLAPNHYQRDLLLARTGHRYFPPALHAVLFPAVLAVALVFVAGVGRGLGRVAGRRPVLRWSQVLPVAQAAAFAALEIAERMVAHAPLGDVWLVLALGLPLQAFVGFLAGRLVAQFEEAGEHLGRRLRRARTPERATGGRTVALAWWPSPSPESVAIPARGPPVDLVPA